MPNLRDMIDDARCRLRSKGDCMREELTRLMDFCRRLGADYADVRVKDIWTQTVAVEDGKVKSLNSGRSAGCGIRVYVGGSLGFCATGDMSKLEEAARKAHEIALASRRMQSRRICLAPKPAVIDRFSTPVEIDPETVPLGEKISLLLDCERIMRAVAGVSRTGSNMTFRKESVVYHDMDAPRRLRAG